MESRGRMTTPLRNRDGRDDQSHPPRGQGTARGTALHTGARLLQVMDHGMAPGLPARPHGSRLPCRGPVGSSPERSTRTGSRPLA